MASNRNNVYNPTETLEPPIDTTGIYSLPEDELHISNSLHRIATHVHKINETLASLDSEMVKYRASIKAVIQKSVANSKEDNEANAWWQREIHSEMKVLHYYSTFCIRVLCQEFCTHNNHTNV